jgi:hypothetical protein
MVPYDYIHQPEDGSTKAMKQKRSQNDTSMGLQRILHNNTLKVTQQSVQPKTWESHSWKCPPFTVNRASYKYTYEIAERSPPQHFEGFAPMNAV